MSRRSLWLFAFFICACGGSPFPGFKQVDDSAYLKHHVLGDGSVVPSDSDSVLLRVRFARFGEEPGSFMSTERWYLTRDLRSGAMLPVLRRLHVGDSMSVIADQGSWPWATLAQGTVPALNDTALLQMEISMRDLRSPAMIRADLDRLKDADPLRFEQQLIVRWIAENGEEWTRWGSSDLYYRIEGEPFDTARVRFGEHVTLSWKGVRLVEGTVFDDRTSFEWRFGDTDQVIKGLEVATSLLRPGQMGNFIIPSSLAFGERGIPGTLEPRSPVLYSVSLREAERTMANQ